MEEYTVVFKGGVAKGLRPSSKNPKNTGALVIADGVMQEAGELFNHPDLDTFDISAIAAQTFPFPQLFFLRNWTIVCTPTKIYTYDGTLNLVYTATEGSTWTVADFYDFLVFANGREYIVLSPDTGAWSKYLDAENLECLCVADINGQLFVGGPDVTVGAGWLG